MSEEKPFSEAYATLVALNALGDAWNASPPMKRLGARLEFRRLDRVRAVIDPVEIYHRGGMGTDAVNGVILAGLFDLAIGTVVWLSMTFLKPTRGDRVTVEAGLLRAGTNLTFASAEIFDGNDKVTARCDGTVAVALGRYGTDDFFAGMRGGL